jgi:hypothetical protein
MDPLTVSTTLATIVGLVCNFKQVRKGSRDDKHQEFMEWLEYHRHEELKKQIVNNQQLMTEVDALLKQDTETILARLGAIDDMLARILSHVEGFAGVARILKPGIDLSDQAIHVLRGLVHSKSDKFHVVKYVGSPIDLGLVLGGHIKILDPRFIEADLETLVNMGLLRMQFSSSGTPFFGITRQAAKLIDLIDQKPS